MINRQIRLKSRPSGLPTLENFELVKADVPTPRAGEILVRNRILSLDPYMRGQMDGAKSYVLPVNLDSVMNGHTIGEVVQSNDPNFAPGDQVWSSGDWQDYAIQQAPPAGRIRKIDPGLGAAAWLGPLGLPGWTAYVGLLDLGAPKKGETIVVTAASGAVGGLVGQLAKARGLHTVGVAGGPDKCAYAVNELGFDVCIDYKAANFSEALAAACPNGVDIDFENVGGMVLQKIWKLLNPHARVVVSGLIAEYNLTEPFAGPNLTTLLKQRVTVRGFIISDHFARLPEAIKEMAGQLARGTLKWRADTTDGLENAPRAFIGMLEGRNFGKTLVQIA
ncbi:MAG: NADPH-dependent curcumin reductase [Mycobacterium sp.]|jgi:NADPH-dependent curcumin reductase CurA|nr:NADPH-dependent curcumin reductase [Mycobacterium sp.]